MPNAFIIKSNNVFTGLVDEVQPAVIAVEGERIVAVEPTVEYLIEGGTATVETPVLDYSSAFVCPGFHDAHMHFFHSAIYSSDLATIFLGENEADCVRRMRELAKKRPEGWLLAQGWREYRWNPPVMPTKYSLDKAFPDRPVALYSGDAHTLWLNSAALEQLCITDKSVPPEGGYYQKDENGELTGIVGEVAAMELMPKIMASFSVEEISNAYKGLLARLASFGITSVCDMSLAATPGLDFIRDDVYARLLDEGALIARVHMFPTLLDNTERFDGMQKRYTSPMLQVRGFKQFFDGVSSQHTAWLAEPYTNSEDGDCGRPSIDPEIMRKRVLNAAQAKRAVRIHTIGDMAIHSALDIYEEALEKFGELPDGQHNCLEHLENFQPEDIERMSRLNVVASVQPPHITLDPGGPERDLGPSRVPFMWPFRSLLDSGATIAFGTDSPVVDVNPFDVIYAAVTRRSPVTHEPKEGWLPEQRITPAEALKAYTHGSAEACGRAQELGQLAPGMLADIVVLDTNLLTCAPDDIQKTEVIATYVGGQKVYDQRS